MSRKEVPRTGLLQMVLAGKATNAQTRVLAPATGQVEPDPLLFYGDGLLAAHAPALRPHRDTAPRRAISCRRSGVRLLARAPAAPAPVAFVNFRPAPRPLDACASLLAPACFARFALLARKNAAALPECKPDADTPAVPDDPDALVIVEPGPDTGASQMMAKPR